MRIFDHYMQAPLPWSDNRVRIGCRWADDTGVHSVEVDLIDAGIPYETLREAPIAVIESLRAFAQERRQR